MAGPPTWDSEIGLVHEDDEAFTAEDLRVYVLMFRRHLPILLLTVTVCVALATLRTLNLPKVYSSTASIRLAKEPPDPAQAKYTMQWEGMPTEYLNSEIRDMLSVSLAVEVVKANREIRRQLQGDLGTTDLDSLALAFLQGVQASPEESTYVVNISYESTAEERCAPYANALAKAYTRQRKTLWGDKTRMAEESTASIASNLALTLAESRRKLDEFLRSHQSPLFERQEDLLIARVKANDQHLDTARLDRIRLDAELETIQRVLEQGRPLETAPTIAQSSVVGALRRSLAEAEIELASLLERFGDSWPAVKEARTRRDQTKLLLRQETDLIVGQLESRRDKRISEEQDLTKVAQELRGKSQDLAQRKNRYERLKSEVEANRRHYREFSGRQKDISSYGHINVANVRIVDPALGSVRVRPNHLSNIVTGLGLGLVLGVVLVVLVDRLSDRIATPSEASRTLQLEALGVVPEVSGTTGTALDRFALTSSRSPFAESFRRARVQLATTDAVPREGCIVLMCASGLPQEGKTVCAINVAISWAMVGKRTLIVDGDMRSPRVHAAFDAPLAPGVVDVLLGTPPLGTIHDTGIDNLFVLPAGYTRKNPAEMLARGTAFRDMITSLRARFDVIVIDSPPVAAFSDGTLMATAADATLLVVSSKASRRSASMQARTELARVGREPCGLIFNHHDDGDYAYYYYAYGGRYTQPDERPPAEPEPPPSGEASGDEASAAADA